MTTSSIHSPSAALEAERALSENVATLMHRTKMRQAQLAAAVGMSQPTLSRRMFNQQPWALWEVQAVAAFFGVTLSEITTDLPSFDEWQARWDDLRARRDSNPKPSVWEPRVIHGSGRCACPAGAVHHPSCPRRGRADLELVAS